MVVVDAVSEAQQIRVGLQRHLAHGVAVKVHLVLHKLREVVVHRMQLTDKKERHGSALSIQHKEGRAQCWPI